MKKTTTKALYLFLCSILGMVLFAMLHRAIFVIYDILLAMDYDTFSFGLTGATVLALDFFTMIIALFLGGWYGVTLGIEWYAMVYGPNSTVQAGLFHAFIPHHFRKTKASHHTFKETTSHVVAPATSSTTVKVPVEEKSDWTFDDLLATAGKPKAASKPKAVRKTVRKTTVRKTKTVTAE